MRKRIAKIAAAAIVALTAALAGAGFYMLDFALSPDPNRHDADSAYTALFRAYPDMKPWVDSLRSHGRLNETYITMADGKRRHALYITGDTAAEGRTAIIVHGYKDCAQKFLYLARLYNRDMGYNVLMPDLYAHGQSEGDHIRMGWKDTADVAEWAKLAHSLFITGGKEPRMVLHGVSMGAATTMCAAGGNLPEYVSCFVEDCGYTSAWDEFEFQLGEMFGLPPFPIMHATSLLCKLRHGWHFGEASPLKQVAKCRRPMLFIHGGADTFVPTRMARPLYEAKPGEKELWIAPGSDHATSYRDHPEEYTRRVKEFVEKHIGKAPL